MWSAGATANGGARITRSLSSATRSWMPETLRNHQGQWAGRRVGGTTPTEAPTRPMPTKQPAASPTV